MSIMIGKIKSFDELCEVVREEKNAGQRVAYCHGCFDLLHLGHIRHFKEARSMGDVLVVSITPDEFVDKGPGRPFFTEKYRLESIASLEFVDYVALNLWPTAEPSLKKMRPDCYVKGAEFENYGDDPAHKITGEAEVARECGIEMRFTHDVVFSSSNLINRFFSGLSEDNRKYLDLLRKKYGRDYFLSALDRLKELKVLVIGDTIIDEYQYTSPLGTSSKDPILAVLNQNTDVFAGGVLAVANHIGAFAGQIALGTVIGGVDSHENFIREQLSPSIDSRFFSVPGLPTTVKHRIIDGYSTNKLIEVYKMGPACVLPSPKETTDWLKDVAADFDLVVVADFGHGFMTQELKDIVSREARFLCVNTQANAGNRGFNFISKYNRMDFASIAEHELRIDRRDNTEPFDRLMDQLFDEIQCPRLCVTRGRQGCVIRNGNGVVVRVPAFAIKTIDRVGAGDAFFSLASLCAALEIDSEAIGFLGNVAGALAVEVIGNRKTLDRDRLRSYVVSLLK